MFHTVVCFQMTAPAPAPNNSRSTASEDVYGEKWDRCLSDTAVKAGFTENIHFPCLLYFLCSVFFISASGLALGIVFSAVLFRRTKTF